MSRGPSMSADGAAIPPKSSLARAAVLARRFGPLALILAGLTAAVASGAAGHLSLHELRVRRAALELLVRAHPIISLAAYIAVYVAAVALSLPAALVLTLTGGLLFGAWLGGGAAALSCTAGATIIFLVCRTAIGSHLRGKADSHIARIEAAVRRDAFSYIVILRLIPVTPFWLANLALGFVEVPLRTFVLASFLGILPVSLIYAGLGSGLDKMFARHERPDLHLVLHAQILVPLLGLAALSLAPIVWRRLRPGTSLPPAAP